MEGSDDRARLGLMRPEDDPSIPDCRRCGRSGWVCEDHPMLPELHILPNFTQCAAAAMPCDELGCPFRWEGLGPSENAD